MQTFLPYPDIDAIAHVLDNSRLNNQIKEAYQIILALMEPKKSRASGGWIHHPAVQMWRENLGFLARYGLTLADYWDSKHTDPAKFHHECRKYFVSYVSLFDDSGSPPWWWGWEPIHLSHRANLIRKNPNFYYTRLDREATRTVAEWSEIPYVWPMIQGDGTKLLRLGSKKEIK